MYSSETFARICKVSYEYEHDRETVLHRLLGDKFTILKDYSDRDILTVRAQNGIYIVAFRGTDLVSRGISRGVSDLISDINIAIGKNEQIYRIQQGNDLIIKLFQSGISKNKVILTGHSLGGFVGVNLATKHKLKAVLFNIGSSPLDSVGVRRNLKNISHYTTNNIKRGIIDILSISSLFLYRIKYYIVKVKPNMSIHTINNFI